MPRVREHFDLLRKIVTANDGTFIKTIGDAVMAVFTDPVHALGAALEMRRRIERENGDRQPPHTLKIGIHQGACFAVNMNDNLDYFGTAVNIAARIQKNSRGGDVIVTREVFEDTSTKRLKSRSEDFQESGGFTG